MPICRAVCRAEDDRWGVISYTCEAPHGHAGPHFVVMGATEPKARLVWDDPLQTIERAAQHDGPDDG